MAVYISPKDLHSKQLTEFDGHRDEVNSVCFSSDFSFMVTGSDDQKVCVFNVQTKQCKARLEGHKGAVKSVAISPCDQFVASGSFDKTARIWKTSDRSCLHILKGHQKSVEAVAFSSCSIYLCTGSWDRTAILWCIQTGCQIQIFSGHTNLVQSVAFSLKHELLASGSWDFTIRVWTLNHMKNMRVIDKFIKHNKANIDNKVHEDNFVKDTNEQDNTLCLPGFEHNKIKDETISNDDKQRTIKKGGKERRECDSLRSSQICTFYTACQRREDFDSADKMDSFITSKEICVKLVEHNGLLRSRIIDELDHKVANEKHDQNTTLQKVTKVINKNESTKCDSHAKDSKTEDCKILTGHTGNVHAVAFSKCGMLASGSWDKSVRIWNPLSGSCIHILLGHTGWVQAVSFSPDATYCASAADDDSVRVWDLVTAKCVNILESGTYLVHHCAFTSSGHLIVAGASSPPAEEQDKEAGVDGKELTEKQIRAILSL